MYSIEKLQYLRMLQKQADELKDEMSSKELKNQNATAPPPVPSQTQVQSQSRDVDPTTSITSSENKGSPHINVGSTDGKKDVLGKDSRSGGHEKRKRRKNKLKSKTVFPQEAMTATQMEAQLNNSLSQIHTLWELDTETSYLQDFSFVGDPLLCQELSWFQLHNINYFGHIGGFDALLARIGGSQCPINFDCLIQMLQCLASLRDYFNTDFLDHYVLRLTTSLQCYFNGLPDSAVKDLNRNIVDKILKVFNCILINVINHFIEIHI
ncbi:hypothetical protein RFI_19543 [Reticulomyxa filosa]|uniref:Uncharacterized protein n=1 Tax=Reticulomyxa filosa TaxID=46433 RepID=X6MV87_RETFI|nr:hypothetical protein RFI_19543 [Reticulomyxa filosa]|eukprot:ETO17769.1 hypothetical protein RFI_19543 [Reticulomyxa filosa]